ncbi:multicopper oxidase domain-containing protein [Methyloterricola oryzae]|uniref:multicopper oxidase domain-containing protein n=1 Tax=Methyloterricola oryzae TaxID=1495050 RepID=UPI0006994A2B|nr:multicopper oxidase domain-containing protein [Methyloterricola oryzae]
MQAQSKPYFNVSARFQLKRTALAVMTATATMGITTVSLAGPGFGDAYDVNNQPFIIQSYFASSPAGDRQWDPATGAPAGYDPANQTVFKAAVDALYGADPYPGTGKALRKFVDPTPLLGQPQTLADGSTSKYIPVAVPTKWVNPQGVTTGDDYYELAVVEYSEKMHSDLPKATTLRGYVQIDHLASNGLGAVPGSKQLALYYPNSSGKVAFASGDAPADAKPIMINGTDANGKLTGTQVPAIVVDEPHYLGPAVVARQHTPTRYKFYNLLPVGRAETETVNRKEWDKATNGWSEVPTLGVKLDANGSPLRHGDLFLPVDPSIVGAGLGPDGMTEYTQNRISVHLHGGDNPWMSDGTPHQWFTPAGEADPSLPGSLASNTNVDPALLPEFLRGPSAKNIPDMNDPGPGAQTLYFPNGQSARLEWFHDHAVGLTRLNVMAGMAAPYVLTDATEASLISSGAIPDATHTIPLVLQDKSFVPADIKLQDARWSETGWGKPGDIWYPHVYETVQDPKQATNFNAVGRWHWGPWFWPVFPALYNLPSGAYGDVTTVPEAWGDTPVVNGVAYPTLTVEAKPYRFRVLNASNDRFFTFNFFQADNKQVIINVVKGGSGYDADSTLLLLNDGKNAPATATPTIDVNGTITGATINANTIPAGGFARTPDVLIYSTGGSGAVALANLSEVKMVPVQNWPKLCDAGVTRASVDAQGNATCVPDIWTTDIYGHNGGVPDPATQGPTIYQIASEGGFLPGVAKKDPTPISYLLDKGRAAVLNVDYSTSGLQLGNAERADFVVDFSCYAGKTLLVYNDGGAPVPAADPRNEYFTGYGDNSATGGAEDTRPGYGPNTRTLMQVKVTGTAPASCANSGSGVLQGNAAAEASLDRAIKSAYKASQETPVVAQSAYNGALGTNWNDTQAFGTIFTGSLKQPTFNFIQGTANTTGAINAIQVTAQGDGYITPPAVTLPAPNDVAATEKVQATAVASLKINHLHVIDGGSGYKVAPTVTVTSLGKGNGAGATTSLKVSAVQVANGGSGYNRGNVASVSLTNPGTYTASAVGAVSITNGGRYNTNNVTVTFSAPPAGGVQAIGTVIMTGTGTNRRVSGVNITNPGSGYTSVPTVTFSNGTTRATGTVTGLVRKAPTVTFATPTGGTPATGTVVFDSNTGAVTGINLTSGGTGYDSAPVPTFVGGSLAASGANPAAATTQIAALPVITFPRPLGIALDATGNRVTGTTATGKAVVNASGVITGVTITNPGSGYTIAPTPTTTGTAKFTSTASVGNLILDIPDPTNPESGGGGGYDNLLTDAADPVFQAAIAAGNPIASRAGLTITMTAPPAGGVQATGGATGKVFDVTLTNSGKGYTGSVTANLGSIPASNSILAAATTVPTMTRSAATANGTAGQAQATDANGNLVYTDSNGNLQYLPVGSTVPAGYTPVYTDNTGSILVKTKAIQELFEPTYGRLNATLGVEVPFTSALTQTTIPLGYVDAPTEKFGDGEVQIWKITHNGVDTHPVHFHMLNVQLINRVGWDNFITPPEPNELGWKETIKMSPLEDVIVAVRAKKPALRQSSAGGSFAAGSGFGLPNSSRLMDPSQPEGAMTGFTQIDPNTGLPAAMYNQRVDYGWEYVWHCHILGHEENDFMRPVVFDAREVVPAAATGLAFNGGKLTWVDNANTEFQYTVQYRTSTTGAWTAVTTEPLPANSTEVSLSAAQQVSGTAPYFEYQVVATGQAGSALSEVLTVGTPPLALPAQVTGLSATATRIGLTANDSVALTWTTPITGGAVASYTINRCTLPVFGNTCANGTTVTVATGVNTTNYSDTVSRGGFTRTRYGYWVAAVNATGTGQASTQVNVTTR